MTPMPRLLRPSVVSVLLILLLVNQARAWSYKEHIQFTRIAIERILNDPNAPAGLKDWLKSTLTSVPDLPGEEDYFLHTHIGLKPEGFTGILYWAYIPDVHALTDPQTLKIAPFDASEKYMHYIDLEIFQTGDAQRAYKHDLSSKPRIENIPHDSSDQRYVQAGYLPFRIEQCYHNLVEAIRQHHLTADSVANQEGKTAIYWAGYLAHYLGDTTQPQHGTIDYKSQSYFAAKLRGPNVHAEVEYRMADDEVNEFMDLRNEYWPLFAKQLNEFKDPVATKDPFRASLEVVLGSYAALPLIGLAAMHATKQAGTPDHPVGPNSAFDTEAFFRFKGNFRGREMTVMEMKAIQTAWAVNRIEHTFRQAWDDANSPQK